MKKTPLGRSKGLERSSRPLGRAKTAKGRRRQRDRRETRFRRQFHSEERAEFVKRLPCVCGGLGRSWGCKGMSQNSHDPTRGAGGTYLDIHPASVACHALIEDNDFWHRIGKTREEANAETETAWQQHEGGLNF